MTFATRLAGNTKDLVLWVTIQGIKRVFKSHDVAVSLAVLGETRDESATLMDVSEGESEIDYERLAQVGGGLSFKIVQPYGQTFLADVFQPRKRRMSWLTSDLAYNATTIVMDSTAWLTAGDDIYIAQETIRVGTVLTGTTLTGCTGRRSSPTVPSSSTPLSAPKPTWERVGTRSSCSTTSRRTWRSNSSPRTWTMSASSETDSPSRSSTSPARRAVATPTKNLDSSASCSRCCRRNPLRFRTRRRGR